MAAPLSTPSGRASTTDPAPTAAPRARAVAAARAARPSAAPLKGSGSWITSVSPCTWTRSRRPSIRSRSWSSRITGLPVGASSARPDRSTMIGPASAPRSRASRSSPETHRPQWAGSSDIQRTAPWLSSARPGSPPGSATQRR